MQLRDRASDGDILNIVEPAARDWCGPSVQEDPTALPASRPAAAAEHRRPRHRWSVSPARHEERSP